MFKFLKNIFKAKPSVSAIEESYDLSQAKHLFAGTGKSEVKKDSILISDYPFKPSVAYPEKEIYAKDIDSIQLEFGIGKIFTENDIIFISAEHKTELEAFVKRHNIPLSEHNWNWDYLLEPYLDTEFDKEDQQKTIEILIKNGVSQSETEAIRKEVGKQMMSYNFDTMLWEWVSLNLYDVLSAMRAKYNDEQFADFYKRALYIEKRTETKND